MTYGMDDAFATTIVIGDGGAGEVVPGLTVRMFPPALLAKRVLRQLAKNCRFEVVRGTVIGWRPRSDESMAHVAVARNGRTVVTAGKELLFDDSVGAMSPDSVDRLWMTFARQRGKVLVYVGGPARVQTLADLEQAAVDGLLVAAWADVSLPDVATG